MTSAPSMCHICHEVFGNSILMVEHRTGNPRRCMTADEIRATGQRKDRLGVWRRNAR